MIFNNYKPIRLIELFAGIGSQAKALTNLGLNFEHWRVCEFDEHAVRSYNAVHGTHFVTSDITKISAADLGIANTDEFTYLLTYSFPCQDLSNAGKGAGMEKGSGTRSGLLWEVERLLNECDELPQVLLMENVPQVHGTKNKEHFDKWIAFLESKGYSNHWQDLNAKDYGVPQSRNRCYMVSILGDYSYEFPVPIPLELRLGDLLEQEVDERYYISDTQAQKISAWKAQQKPLGRVLGKESISPTLTARGAGENHSGMVILSEELNDTTNLNDVIKQTGCIVSKQGKQIDKFTDVAATLMARDYKGFGNQGMTAVAEYPAIDDTVKAPSELQKEVCNKAIESDLVQPYDIIDYTYSNSRLGEIANGQIKTKNSTDNQIANTITCQAENFGVCVPRVVGGVGEKKSNGGTQYYQQDRIYDDNVAIAVTTSANPYYAVSEPRIIREEPLEREGWHDHAKEVLSPAGLCRTICAQSNNTLTKIKEPASLRIRKLTPKECWRLMGFDDTDVENAAKVCSNSQLYKQAGNSIVVDVLMAIFKELFVPKKTRSQWLDDLLN